MVASLVLFLFLRGLRNGISVSNGLIDDGGEVVVMHGNKQKLMVLTNVWKIVLW